MMARVRYMKKPIWYQILGKKSPWLGFEPTKMINSCNALFKSISHKTNSLYVLGSKPWASSLIKNLWYIPYHSIPFSHYKLVNYEGWGGGEGIILKNTIDDQLSSVWLAWTVWSLHFVVLSEIPHPHLYHFLSCYLMTVLDCFWLFLTVPEAAIDQFLHQFSDQFYWEFQSLRMKWSIQLWVK